MVSILEYDKEWEEKKLRKAEYEAGKSDGDGLSDYHEKMIAAGKMHTGSGEALRLCTTMNYLSSDSDGDGLADSEEVEIRKIPNSENYYCYMVSNPCVVDTDCDSYNDYVEEYIGSSPVSKINKIEQTESSTSGYSIRNANQCRKNRCS